MSESEDAGPAAATLRLDRYLKVTGWDAGAEQLFGWTAREAIGVVLTELISADAQRLRRIKCLFEDGHWEGRAVVAGRDGVHVAVWLRAIGERDGDGRVIGYDVSYWRLRDSAAYRELLFEG